VSDKLLTNPRGALHTFTTFVGFKDVAGILMDYPAEYAEFESNGAISRGAPVIFVVPTATTPLRVAATGAAPVGITVRGIAMNTVTAAGQMVQVCTWGFCEVIVDETPTAAAAFGTRGIASTAEAGRVDSTSAALDATSVVGDHLGTFLGAQENETTDLCPFWYDPR